VLLIYKALKHYKPVNDDQEMVCELLVEQFEEILIVDSTVVFWPTIDAPSSRYGCLLLGKQRGKESFRSLPELKPLVGI